jgi:hypothetical protein
MATLLKVLNNLADIKSAGGVALRVRTQGDHFLVEFLCLLEVSRQYLRNIPLAPCHGAHVKQSLQIATVEVAVGAESCRSPGVARA